tara:strand:+ start:71 stop:691 length:621 start_codon:yes stop_codon:yes gene_type:complete
MESTVPDKFVEIVNDTADKVLGSEAASVEWDWSHKLVGKVHKEVQIPVKNKEHREFLFTTMKSVCVDYLKESIKQGNHHTWKKLAGDSVPTVDNIHLTHSWVVSQYAGEYNPWHHHSGDFSAVIYLKLPPNMHKEIEEDSEDHYPANGLIEFMFGENQSFRNDNLKFKPEVGKLLMFPSYLRHFVYPFKSKGERRSMSFNANMVIE